jgi:hypothetical protein
MSHWHLAFFLCFEIGSCYATQVGLELEIFLPQLPECWDYKCVPLCLASKTLFLFCMVLGLELGAYNLSYFTSPFL